LERIAELSFEIADEMLIAEMRPAERFIAAYREKYESHS
jgi:hypothetical protein